MKETNNVIYLHGLQSSPNGTKAECFRRMSKEDNYNFYAPNMGPDFVSTTFDDKLRIAEEMLTNETFLIGSSLGGYIASLLAQKHPDKIKKLALIAPAMNIFSRHQIPSTHNYEGYPKVSCPSMVFAGRKDTVVPKEVIDKFVEQNPHCEYVYMPDADHRMHSELIVLRAYIREFFSRD